MRSAILRALAMSWVIESAVTPRSRTACDDQIVDDVGHDRIEAGGRLVEEDDLGLGGDGAGEADALLHAARKLGRAQLADLGAEADRGELLDRDLLRALPAPCRALDQAEGDVLPDRQAVEQRARPGTACRTCACIALARGAGMPTVSSPSIWIEPASGCIRPRMHLISTDLPDARAADDDEGLLRRDVEIEAVEHHLRPEALVEAADLDLGGLVFIRGEEELGDEVVEREDQDRGGNHRVGGRRPTPCAPPRE